MGTLSQQANERHAMSFTESLLDPTRRPQVVQAIATVVDQEVAAKSGLGGMALKGA